MILFVVQIEHLIDFLLLIFVAVNLTKVLIYFSPPCMSKTVSISDIQSQFSISMCSMPRNNIKTERKEKKWKNPYRYRNRYSQFQNGYYVSSSELLIRIYRYDYYGRGKRTREWKGYYYWKLSKHEKTENWVKLCYFNILSSTPPVQIMRRDVRKI